MRIAIVALFVVGCGAGDPTHHEPDEYTGCSGDEQFRLFDDAEPVATVIDDTQAPQITQPTGAIAPYQPKAIWQWNQDFNDPGESDGDVPYVDGTPECKMCCPEFNTGALTSLHLPSISGNMYDLHFYIGDSYVHRVITTLQEWTAPDELWQSWRGQTVSLDLYRAEVLVNQIKEGPFLASKRFSIRVGQ